MIRKRSRAPGQIGLEVGDRHAVPQRERAERRRHDRAPLGHDPVQGEGETVAVVDQPGVARVAAGEAVDVPLARRHRRAAELDDTATRCRREPLHRERRTAELGAKVRAPAAERRVRKRDRGEGELRVSARRRVRCPGASSRLASIASKNASRVNVIARHRRDAPDEECTVGRATP